MSSRELCAGPGRSSLEVVDGGQLPDGGFSLRRPYIHISGGELHMCASRPTRDASASKCAAMLEGLGHERGAHQRWSARSGAALDRDVQVVRHRALRLHRADLPRTTMLMPAHLRGAKQGDGLTGRQWRREWAKDGAKPDSPADRSTNVCNENSILLLGHRQAGGAQCAHRLTTEWRRASLTAAYS